MELEMTSNINYQKIEKVLEKFLDPQFNVKNEVYLNLFLTHLTGKNAVTEKGDSPLQERKIDPLISDICCKWLIHATQIWDKNKIKPKLAILSFSLKLSSGICTDEHLFVKLNSQNVFEILTDVVQKISFKDPSVTLGLVTMLCSFLEHKSGVQWIMATVHWSNVVTLGLKGSTMYIRKKVYQFSTKLLEKTINLNTIFGENIVTILVKPLKDVFLKLTINKGLKNMEVQNRELFDSLKPSLQFISEVLLVLIKRFNKDALHLFIKQDLSEVIEQILLLSQNEEFTYELLKVQFILLFFNMCTKLDGVQVVAHNSFILCDVKVMFDLINEEMSKNNIKCVIKISEYAHELYCNLAPRLPLRVRNGEIVEFENQMIIFHLVPIMVFNEQHFPSGCNANSIIMNDDYRRGFIQKLLKMASVKTIELYFKWENQLLNKENLIDDVVFGLQYIAKTKKLLNKERAATIFPALVYSLKDCLTILQEIPYPCEFSSRRVQYLTTLIDAIVDLVESFNLTWKDTIETTCVMDIACDFLRYPRWNNKIFVIKGLKLLNTAISKYMSPDMVLLIYNTEGSIVAQTGSILYEKCHDSCWEIRDSALEVVYTLASNANSKFPALTSVLLIANIPQLVVEMALKDGESFVRTTSFRCLQEFVQIQEIWDVLSQMNSFLTKIINVLEVETEGIVRSQAAQLLYRIEYHQQYPDELFPRLYDVMTHATIADLHWEVKLSALNFWFSLFRALLINQGMQDRAFPTHTFSKELKKIVTLNELEVRKRLIKVLNQLAQTGALYVFKCAIQDECDIEVSRKAIEISEKVVSLYRKYKVSSENLESLDTSSRLEFSVISKPASSTTLTASSPASICDLTYLEIPDALDNDPLSPLLNFLNQSPESEEKYSLPPVESISNHLRSDYQSKSIQNLETQTPGISICELSQVNSSGLDILDSVVEMDTYNGGSNEAVTTNGFIDPTQREEILDEFLNSNDLVLLQGIYNPNNEPYDNTMTFKKRTYLSPSEYLKFIYNAVDAQVVEKTQRTNKMDDFDSLLEDILEEYDSNSEVNSMDCY